MLELRLPNISVAIPDGAPAAVAPAVERLRRGSAAYVATGAKCQQLEAELRDASKADLDADAAAILAGQPAPQPGAVAVDAKLTDARKQLDASAAACVAGVRELVAAIDAATDDWLTALDERRPQLVSDVRAAVDVLAAASSQLGDDESTRRWLADIAADGGLRLVSGWGGSGVRLSKFPKPSASTLDFGVTSALDALRAWVEHFDQHDHEPVELAE